MSSKIAFLLDGTAEGMSLSKTFSWKVMADGTWDFTNGKYPGRGHFILVSYSGASGSTPSPTAHELHLGDVVGIRNGRAWKVNAQAPSNFHFYGVAMGWYDDSDGVFVQVSGVIKGLSDTWVAGSPVYVPAIYGLPDIAPLRGTNPPVLGMALNASDLLLIPRAQ